ncbi:MAG: replication protein RepA [Janthinobacterium lividum]
MQFELPIGQRYARQALVLKPEHLRIEAIRDGHLPILEAMQAVSEADLVPAYLHSALCAMSLPARRPKDEMAPIIREDGRYTLAITPKPVLRREGGEMKLTSLGVPFGSYPRVILIYIMSEAVRTGSRDVYLGGSFAEWLRRLGYTNASHGSRGTASLLKGQLDRLLACEWMIRWDDSASDDAAFAVKEVKLANEYAGLRSKDGTFIKEIKLADGFFTHLREHAVPLNETAIRELKNNPTALDLYTYFAYRLQRIDGTRPSMLSWTQLATHLGSAAESPRKFRQSIRQNWDLVSGVYPNARVDLTGPVIKMWESPPPVEKRLVGPHLHLVRSTAGDGTSSIEANQSKPTLTAVSLPSATHFPKPEVERFPKGSLTFGDIEKPFRLIAKEYGGGYDIDNIADAYRAQVGPTLETVTGSRLLKSFQAFCISYVGRRGPL